MTSVIVRRCRSGLKIIVIIIIQNVAQEEEGLVQVTATTFMPALGQLACGRSDGSIVIVPASLSITRQLLDCGGGGHGELYSALYV